MKKEDRLGKAAETIVVQQVEIWIVVPVPKLHYLVTMIHWAAFKMRMLNKYIV